MGVRDGLIEAIPNHFYAKHTKTKRKMALRTKFSKPLCLQSEGAHDSCAPFLPKKRYESVARVVSLCHNFLEIQGLQPDAAGSGKADAGRSGRTGCGRQERENRMRPVTVRLNPGEKERLNLIC